jgi:hypothetical protein
MRGWLLSASANRPKGAATLRFGALVTEVGDMQVAGRLPHRPLAPPVVAGRRRRVGVPRKLLYRREIAYGVQEVADEGVFPLTSIVALLTLQTR